MTIKELISYPFTLQSKGYPRIKQRGIYRDKLAHRVVIEILAEEQLVERPTAKLFLPENYQIHHIDFNKLHRCPNNLLILSPELHTRLHLAHRKFKERLKNEWYW